MQRVSRAYAETDPTAIREERRRRREESRR